MPGMIVAPQPLAVEQGARVLMAGGNAYDAAVACAFMQFLLDPHSCGVGGYLLLTTRSPGFPYHGFPGDYWRFTTADMRRIIEDAGLDVITVADDKPDTPGVLVFARKPRHWKAPQDLYWLDLAIATI